MSESLAEALPKELARVREVQKHYAEIGPDGMFGYMMIEQTIRKADKAIISGDVVAMLQVFGELKEIES